MTNEEAAREFAAQFSPTLNVVPFLRLAGSDRDVKNGWMVAGIGKTASGQRIGVTMHIHGAGVFRAFTEIAGRSDTLAAAGSDMAKLFAE